MRFRRLPRESPTIPGLADMRSKQCYAYPNDVAGRKMRLLAAPLKRHAIGTHT